MTAGGETAPPEVLVALAEKGADALSKALEAGGDANARDRWGTPALCRASGRGDLTAVRLLLEHGGDPNRTSDAGNSPLMVAVAGGHANIVRALLDAGADADSKNRWGLAAADWAKWAKDPGEIGALLRAPRRES